MATEFRRKAPRRSFTGTLGVLHKGNVILSPGLQIGEGGALFNAQNENVKIQAGDSIVITIFFAEIGGIVVRADCLYRNESGDIGVSFREIAMNFKKRVRQYVSHRGPS